MDSLIHRLSAIKNKMMTWPDGQYHDEHGQEIDPDAAFKLIEVDLQNVLNSILALPESQRVQMKEAVQDFKQAMADRQKEAEEKLSSLKQKAILTQDTSRALKAYNKTIFQNTDLSKNEST